MKLNKSLITCAVVMALGLNQTAFAGEDTKVDSNTVTIQSDLMVNALGNVIMLSQSSTEGTDLGNETTIFQEGDVNGAGFTVIGEGNVTEISQLGAENLAVGTATIMSSTLSKTVISTKPKIT